MWLLSFVIVVEIMPVDAVNIHYNYIVQTSLSSSIEHLKKLEFVIMAK